MGDDDALGGPRQLAERIGEPADVRLVERRVHFVEHAERHRPHLEHGEQQGDGRQGALAAREHRQCLGLLARRPRRDLDARRGEVLRIGEGQVGIAPAEQLLEPAVERLLQGGERAAELVADELVELGDQGARLLDGPDEVGALQFHPVEAGTELCVLVGREGVHRTEVVEAPAEGG